MKERDRKRRDRANSKIGSEAMLKAVKNSSRSNPYRVTKKDTGCPEDFLRVRTCANSGAGSAFGEVKKIGEFRM